MKTHQNQKKRKQRVKNHIARRRLMNIPEDVGFNHIKPSLFGLKNQIFPHLRRHHFTTKLEKSDRKLKKAGNFQ